MKWENVNEKLPEHLQQVLCLHKSNEMYVLIFIDHKKMMEKLEKELDMTSFSKETTDYDYSFASKEIRGNCLSNVTHWMPLPELPNA